MDQLIIKKVFIASPGDLSPERTKIKQIIEEINVNKAHAIGVHIELIGWELIPPGLGRPQELINNLLAKADLFVMVMWRRWGTPSGKYSSGTEEEFYTAKNLNEQSGKPAISVFFKKIDEINESNIDDCKRIIDFRKKIEEGKELMFKVFETSDEWDRYASDAINSWLDNTSLSNEKSKELTKVLPVSQRIQIEITFIDRHYNGSKDEIYFTILDEKSFGEWKGLNDEEKKTLLFYFLSNYLYLNLGVQIYKGILRFKIENNRHLFLGLIKFPYNATIEESYFYLPPDYHQVMTCLEPENSILDLFRI